MGDEQQRWSGDEDEAEDGGHVWCDNGWWMAAITTFPLHCSALWATWNQITAEEEDQQHPLQSPHLPSPHLLSSVPAGHICMHLWEGVLIWFIYLFLLRKERWLNLESSHSCQSEILRDQTKKKHSKKPQQPINTTGNTEEDIKEEGVVVVAVVLGLLVTKTQTLVLVVSRLGGDIK